MGDFYFPHFFFGSMNLVQFTTDVPDSDGVIFFVIHPNSWGPFHDRFKTNALTSFVKHGEHTSVPFNIAMCHVSRVS